METPPALPPSKLPLGRQFYLLLLAPLGLMALSACCLDTEPLASILISLTSLTTLVCSIILARLLGRRLSKPGGSPAILSVLLFIGLQLFYGICFFLGCTAVIVFS
jgi:hypothetical protein